MFSMQCCGARHFRWNPFCLLETSVPFHSSPILDNLAANTTFKRIVIHKSASFNDIILDFVTARKWLYLTGVLRTESKICRCLFRREF